MTDAFAPFRVRPDDGGRKFDTLQVHAGHRPDPFTKARAVPIYATASYVFTDSDHAARVCTNKEAGYVYSRIANPTVEVFEKRVAALEGGVAAVACASGQAAVFQTVLCLAHCGDNIVSSVNLYGGSYSMFKNVLPRMGIEVRFVADESPASFRALIDERTKIIFTETIGNPRVSVADLEGIASVAKEAHVPFVLDNTFGAAGYWCPAFRYADITVHSATKWIGGHGACVGGVIVDSGNFDWGAAAAKFPHLTALKGDGPMAFSYWKTFGKMAFAIALRIDVSMEVGATMSPFAAQQLLLGVETLSLRCDRIAHNALSVARWLESHERVSWVNYPGLESSQWHHLAKRYLARGFGGVLSLGVRGGKDGSKAFVDNLDVISNMTNVGDGKTMATHPWSSTHSIMTEEDRLNAGITEDLIRLSIGTEDIEDLLKDLTQALTAIPQNVIDAQEMEMEIASSPTSESMPATPPDTEMAPEPSDAKAACIEQVTEVMIEN